MRRREESPHRTYTVNLTTVLTAIVSGLVVLSALALTYAFLTA